MCYQVSFTTFFIRGPLHNLLHYEMDPRYNKNESPSTFYYYPF